jgi:type II secretory ATPase GspE/PulE/Tfp pilus assembly ATPase PilB-like protein
MARHDYDIPADYEKRVEEGTMSEWYEKERNKRQVMRQDTSHSKEVNSALERIKRRSEARSLSKRVDNLAEATQEKGETLQKSVIEIFNEAFEDRGIDIRYDPEDFADAKEEKDSESLLSKIKGLFN